MRIAEAVVRNLRDKKHDPRVLPRDALAWRNLLGHAGATVTLHDIISDLWKRGIPVVPLDVLPAPSFQGMSCIVESRPVILLGYKHDEPGRVAFRVAHEAGHLATGDCGPDRPVVDEQEEIADDTESERRADQYATCVLVGDEAVPSVESPGVGFRLLAHRAAEIERTTGADASTVLFAWARRTGDYPTATMAVKALYRHLGARRELRELFGRHVELPAAAETDRALLRCVYGDPERNEAGG